MTQADAAAVRRQIVVNAPLDKAFEVFTHRFGDFKPPEHNLLPVPIAETVFEPRVGGHIYDRGTDGSECRWARILAYDPPNRVVFSWDIGPTWQIEADLENTSEVEVTFTAETTDRTRVELEHRHIDRHGPGWESVRDGIGHDQGWPLYLDRYAGLFGEEMAPIVTTVQVDRPADEVFAYATDPTRFKEWQQGVVDGHLETHGTPTVGTRCLTTRRIGGADRPAVSEVSHIDPPKTWGVRGIDGPIRAIVDLTVEPLTADRSQLTISVDFTGHGIGKVLVPLIVRREAAKEMPNNLATLKNRLEQS